jgi:oligoribonuclease NrnB/cAMP/cGMP phosphodiesterase (DHH superfamily)
MYEVAVLSHIADIDGVGSAALIRMRFGMPLENIFFSGYGAEDLKEAEAGLSRLYGKRILLFIMDLSPESETLSIFQSIIRNVQKGGGSVVFLDHHQWKTEMIRKIASKCDLAVIGENRMMCATELARKMTGLRNDFVNEFVDIVHHGDFNIRIRNKRRAELSDTYMMSINHCNMTKSYDARIRKLRRIADVISSGRFSDKEMRKRALEFRRINSERIESMLNDLYHISNKIAVGFSRQVDSTEACEEIIRRSKVDIGMVINLDHGKGSIRSVESDTLRFANELGGGGHPHASGFNIDLKEHNFLRSGEDRKRLVDEISDAAKKSGLI